MYDNGKRPLRADASDIHFSPADCATSRLPCDSGLLATAGYQRDKDLCDEIAHGERHQRAGNDKIVAKLYGITDSELAHLLKSFKDMATKRPEYVALLQA